MTVKSAVLFLVALAFLLVATGLAAAQTACLEGTILDADGPPIAQMHVLASETTHPFFRTAITDENGRFTLTGLIPGTYDITTRNVDLGYPDSGDFHFTGTLDRLLVPVPASEQCAPLTIHRPVIRRGGLQPFCSKQLRRKGYPGRDVNLPTHRDDASPARAKGKKRSSRFLRPPGRGDESMPSNGPDLLNGREQERGRQAK